MCFAATHGAVVLPACRLQTVLEFSEIGAFNPNRPLFFGGGFVIELNYTQNDIDFSRPGSAIFSFSDNGKDVLQLNMGTDYDEKLYFGTSSATHAFTGVKDTSYVFNEMTNNLKIVAVPLYDAFSTCKMYLNGSLTASGYCPTPSYVNREDIYFGQGYKSNSLPFLGTVSNFSLRACDVTSTVALPAMEPQCDLQSDLAFLNVDSFDANRPLIFGGGVVITMQLIRTGWWSVDNENIFSFEATKTNGFSLEGSYDDYTRRHYLFFSTKVGTSSSYIYSRSVFVENVEYTLHIAMVPGNDPTQGNCSLYVNGVREGSTECPIPDVAVEYRVNRFGEDGVDVAGYKKKFHGNISNFNLSACLVEPTVSQPVVLPSCTLRNEVEFAEESSFDPNRPLFFGGGIALQMNVSVVLPSADERYAILFTSSINGTNDVLELSIGRYGLITLKSRVDGDWNWFYSATKLASYYSSPSYQLLIVIVPGSDPSADGACYIYINGLLDNVGECPVPNHIERNFNLAGRGLAVRGIYMPINDFKFGGSISDFSLRACDVTATHPPREPVCPHGLTTVPLSGSKFGTVPWVLFGDAIVMELDVFMVSYVTNATIANFSCGAAGNIVTLQEGQNGHILFSIGNKSIASSTSLSRNVLYRVRVATVAANPVNRVMCYIYINDVVDAVGECAFPGFVVRRPYLTGNDVVGGERQFMGNISGVSLSACKFTPMQPMCSLKTELEFEDSTSFDPNRPLLFGGGVVITMTVNLTHFEGARHYAFTFSNEGDIVSAYVDSRTLTFYVSGSFIGINASLALGENRVEIAAVPGSADPTTGACFVTVNGTLSANGPCAIPNNVTRRVNFIGDGLLSDNANPFPGTISDFSLQACEMTPTVSQPLAAPACNLRTVVEFENSASFDPNRPLFFGGGLVLHANVTVSSSEREAAIVNFSNPNSNDVVQLYKPRNTTKLFFGTSHGSWSLRGITSRTFTIDTNVEYSVRAVVVPGGDLWSTVGKCYLYINGVLDAFGECPVPTYVERRYNFIGYDVDSYLPFDGTISDVSLHACNVTPTASQPLEVPQCQLETELELDAPNLNTDQDTQEVFFGGGIVIDVNVTVAEFRLDSALFSSADGEGGAGVNLGTYPRDDDNGRFGGFYLDVVHGTTSTGVRSRAVFPMNTTYSLHAAVSLDDVCYLYVNGVLETAGACSSPTHVDRIVRFSDTNTIEYFRLRQCNESAWTDVPLTPSPSTLSPPTPLPSTTAPSTPSPPTSAPGTPAPSTASPSTSSPGTPAPSTTSPSTSAPSTPMPSTTSPVIVATPTPSTTVAPVANETEGPDSEPDGARDRETGPPETGSPLLGGEESRARWWVWVLLAAGVLAFVGLAGVVLHRRTRVKEHGEESDEYELIAS